MSIEGRGPSPKEMEQEEKNEIQIGGGDIIKVSSLREIIEKKGGERGELEEQDLPAEYLEKVRGALSNLPFRIGSKEHIGTMPRSKHEATVRVGPRLLSHDAPESEKKKKALSFTFDKETARYELSLETSKGLTIQQNLHHPRGPRNVIRFEPKNLALEGEKIGDIFLVMPFEMPEEKS